MAESTYFSLIFSRHQKERLFLAFRVRTNEAMVVGTCSRFSKETADYDANTTGVVERETDEKGSVEDKIDSTEIIEDQVDMIGVVNSDVGTIEETEIKTNTSEAVEKDKNTIKAIDRSINMEMEGKEQSNQKCQYCGQILYNTAFKCTQCNRFIDNVVLDRLSDNDIKLIELNDLEIVTPTLMAHIILDRLKNDDYIKWFTEKKKPNREEQFNLLVFNSFCHFMATCRFATMKVGYSHSIAENLKNALLNGVADLHNASYESQTQIPELSQIQPEHDCNTLVERGEILYNALQTILDDVNWESSGQSQIQASSAFASILFGTNSHLSSSGLILWINFMEMYTPKVLPTLFSRTFLIEEQDWIQQDAEASMTAEKEAKDHNI